MKEAKEREDNETAREDEFTKTIETEKITLSEERKKFEEERQEFERMMRDFNEAKQRQEEELTREEEADSGIGSRSDTAEVYDPETNGKVTIFLYQWPAFLVVFSCYLQKRRKKRLFRLEGISK